MTKAVEVITSVQRRRRWPRSEKERIVAAAMEPAAVASEIARAAGIHTSQLFRWRQQTLSATARPFSAIAVLPEPEATSPPPSATAGVVEVEFAAGGRMRLTGAVDSAVVSALMKVLAKGKRRR